MQWTCVQSHATTWRTVAPGQLPACHHSPAWSDCIPTTCHGAQGDQVQSASQTGLQRRNCPGKEEWRAQPCRGPGSEEEWWNIQSGQNQQCCSGEVHQGGQMPKGRLCHCTGSLPTSRKFQGTCMPCTKTCTVVMTMICRISTSRRLASITALLADEQHDFALNSSPNFECGEHLNTARFACCLRCCCCCCLMTFMLKLLQLCCAELQTFSNREPRWLQRHASSSRGL